MAIVTVIIAVIVTVVISGKSMMQQAKLRAIITEVSSIKAALVTFRQKYTQLPGDFTGAEGLWGTWGWDEGPGTANGDGDGRIATSGFEGATAWQHLSLAGMIPGGYVLSAAIIWGTHIAVPGVYGAYPTAFSPNGGYGFLGPADDPAWSHYQVYRSPAIMLGAAKSSTDGTGNDTQEYGLLTPSDARYIDQKMDDGDAGMGGVIGLTGLDYDFRTINGVYHWGWCTQGDWAAPLPQAYQVQLTQPACYMQFRYDCGPGVLEELRRNVSCTQP